MSVTSPALQELLVVTVASNATTTSVANHGAAPTPTIGGNFTTTTAHPNVDIEISFPYVYASVAGVPSVHAMVDGSADANCYGEGFVYCPANVTGGSIYRKVRVTGLAAGAHTLSIFMKNSTAGTATALGAPQSSAAQGPIFVRVVEAP